MHRCSAITFFFLLIGTVVSTPASAQQPERYTLTGGEVALYNLAGRVELVPAEGERVVVTVDPEGAEAGRLRVETGPIRGRATLRVLYPADRVVYPEPGDDYQLRLEVQENGVFTGEGVSGELGDFAEWVIDILDLEDEADVQAEVSVEGREVTIAGEGSGLEAHADLRVAVPAGTSVSLHLGAGRVRARNIDGDLAIDVAMGDVATENTRGRLLIDTGAGDIRVRRASGEAVLLDTGSGSISVRGVRGADVLGIDTGSGDVSARRVDAKRVEIDTGSGDIEVRQVRGERLLLDTGSGDITVSRIDVSRARFDTGSGSIEGATIAAANLEADTGSGAIRLADVATSEAVLDTGSGSVELGLMTDIESLEIDTGSGSVGLVVPPELGAEIAIDVGSGDIDIEVPVRILEMDDEGEALEGVIGDGRGRIEIDTGSGGVRIVGR